MIDILIPTYNREKPLIKNIRHINKLIKREGLTGNFRLLVSDNCSSDDTLQSLNKIMSEIDLDMIIYKQTENVGLEKNAVFLLEQATSDFVMYVGDDDFLPSGYLCYVINLVDNDKDVAAVVPGMSGLYTDGTIKPSRITNFDEKKYLRGFKAAQQLSVFGHQLSGILLKREALAKTYLESEHLRNIYLFIYFLAFNSLRGNSYYAPKFKVMVSQDNRKDWKYDNSGLLADIFKNFKILYPHDTRKRYLLCISIMVRQCWRLGIGKNPLLAFKAILHLWHNNDIELLIKISLIPLYPYLYLQQIALLIRRRFILISNKKL